ncbi:VOC family protein [Alicyclobacillus contaminans]|uniref:VOC family protein n=1 Tax=Alicyclobacillus contaminans TaxID=392016 RepID=UPI0006881993|nr:VOC family protein [Alicyclobacillus contaminans]
MVLSLTHREGAPRGFDAYGARGFNHVTINVADLAVSLSFYVDTLGMALVHRGRRDVYLEWGDAWICLQERPELPSPNAQLGVDHVALHVSPTAFHRMVEILRTRNVPLVRGPLERGGGWTVNFLDPDGTQLELHTGTLAERMKNWR